MRAAWLVLLFACTSDPVPSPPADTARSGERLKLAWYEFADGFRTWAVRAFAPTDLDIFDAELAAACEPIEWSDEVVRCTPELGFVWYEDAACTIPVVPANDPKRFHAELTMVCGARPTGPVYVATTQTKTLPRVFTGPGCGPLVNPDNASFLVAEVEVHTPSMFVTLRSQLVGEGRIAVETLQGEDGFLAPRRPHDATHGSACSIDRMHDAASGPCLFEGAAHAGWYVDDACLAPAIAAASCETPRIALRSTHGCPRYYEVGPPIADATLFEQVFETCRASQTQVGTAHALGARIESAELVRAPAPATTRAAPIYITHEATRFRDASHLFDSLLEVECMMENVVDGAVSTCRPTIASWSSFLFSDASCTVELPPLVAAPLLGGCVTYNPPAYVQIGVDTFRVGPRHDGVVYEQNGASCNRVSTSLHEVGARIDVPLLMATKRRDP